MAASRKLYVVLAATINRHIAYADNAETKDAMRKLARELASDLKADNMHFDIDRFMDAVKGEI